MHVDFLVEEYSAEAALKNLLPLILPAETTFAIRTFSGKQDLLSQLPKRLRGYRNPDAIAGGRVVHDKVRLLDFENPDKKTVDFSF